MKQFNGFAEAQENAKNTGVGRLPVGGYVCKVLDVKYQQGTNGNSDQIKIMFDIVEGDQKDYFKKKYDANQNEDKKWPGTASIWVPQDDGTEMDGWTKNRFAAWTNAFEESNSGYTWNWDESTFKGKLIGIVFGETGTVIDGKEILYTEARRGESIYTIRNGEFRPEKLKKKNGYTGNGNPNDSAEEIPGFLNVAEGTDEKIPF